MVLQARAIPIQLSHLCIQFGHFYGPVFLVILNSNSSFLFLFEAKGPNIFVVVLSHLQLSIVEYSIARYDSNQSHFAICRSNCITEIINNSIE